MGIVDAWNDKSIGTCEVHTRLTLRREETASGSLLSYSHKLETIELLLDLLI